MEIYEQIWALNYALALIGWDSETYMPEGSAKERGEVTSVLETMKQRLYISQNLLSALEELEESAESDVEKGIVRVLRRTIKYYTAIPADLVKKEEKVVNEAKIAWRRAKKEANFSLFAPYLEEIVEINRKKAEYLGYEDHPYDALLDLYEEGATTRELESFFDSLIPPLERELKRILSSGWPQDHPLEEAPYREMDMETLNREILNLLGFDWGLMRIDRSAHPFTEGIGLYDVRITTWYHGKDFRRSLLATIHEFGHALYERQCDPKFWKTPVCGGVSLGIHESQSRFWENIIARSRAFASFLSPIVKHHLGIEASPDDLFYYFNLVRPSLLRVEADEVTYNFHIALRFEIEKGLIDGSIEVKELPSLWNQRMEEYLGVVPPDDSLGVLQDIHWSLGAMGYFPTYSIGTVVAAQIKEKMEKDLDLENLIEKGEFGPIREWLRERIHRWGAIYPPKELLRRSLGGGPDPEAFLNYVRGKYKW